MNTKVKPIPEGFHTLTPYLMVKGAAQAIDFYKRAFGATERLRMAGPDGKSIAHAEITIGNSIVMLADECPERGMSSPQTLKGTPVAFALYVEDSDAAFKRAVGTGATVLLPIADQFYGDRSGTVQDPFGHKWTLSTHKEDLSPQELNSRMADACAKMGQAKK